MKTDRHATTLQCATWRYGDRQDELDRHLLHTACGVGMGKMNFTGMYDIQHTVQRDMEMLMALAQKIVDPFPKRSLQDQRVA